MLIVNFVLYSHIVSMTIINSSHPYCNVIVHSCRYKYNIIVILKLLPMPVQFNIYRDIMTCHCVRINDFMY